MTSALVDRLQSMNREERRRILGDDVIAHIHTRVAEAPEPTPELVEHLRRIMSNPGGEIPKVEGDPAPPDDVA